VRELKAGFDFVVIDASPLLLVSDALLLAREVDGVVLSVLLGVSQIARVQETMDRLRAVEAEVVGVVVNNVRTDVYRQSAGRSRSLSILGTGAEPARSPAAGAVEV
jgi:Mrp family chromosome partitioning ATPase